MIIVIRSFILTSIEEYIHVLGIFAPNRQLVFSVPSPAINLVYLFGGGSKFPKLLVLVLAAKNQSKTLLKDEFVYLFILLYNRNSPLSIISSLFSKLFFF